MPDYSNGKIYRIVCNETGLVYIGSTCETLSRRLSKHTSQYRAWVKDNSKKYCTSYIILDKQNYYIELLDLYPCICIDELTTREGWHQRNNECINKNIAGRTRQQYLQDNAVQIAEKEKIYREQNKVQVAEKAKQYYTDKQAQILEKAKQYYDENKDIILQKQKDRRLAKKLLSQTNV